MKRRFAFFGAGWGIAFAVPLFGGCAPNLAAVHTEEGAFRFQVEIADDAQERARGLMFRENLDEGAGMLFIYEAPSRVSFWMKNTPTPLDILFFTEKGVLQHIAHETEPFSLEKIRGGKGVAFVLEINAGLSKRLGIREGARLAHPRINQAIAAAPCGD